MKQEQFDRLENLLKSIKYIDKEIINDKAFNEVVCEILNIQTDKFVSADDYKHLKNIRLNEENPEIKKISDNLIQTLNPYQFNEEIEGEFKSTGINKMKFKSTGINEMKFKPYSNNDNFLVEQ